PPRYPLSLHDALPIFPCSPLDEPVGAVCAPGELGVVGRDEERKAPFGLKTHEQIEDDLTRLRIEVAGRLVGENGPRVVHQRAREDRKSTRLNSSHVSI